MREYLLHISKYQFHRLQKSSIVSFIKYSGTVYVKPQKQANKKNVKCQELTH